MPAIYYHPEAFSISGPWLMGRNAAGESFLRGYLKHSKSNEFWIQIENSDHVNDFRKKVLKAGRNEPIRSVETSTLQTLSQAKVLFYPGPDISRQAYCRTFHGDGMWSLCGITHTTSSIRAMDSIVDLITSPVQPWDALICTSKSVKDNVEKVLQAQINYLKDRLGITKFVAPQLPIIPLGINTDDFSFSENEKNSSRNKLDISNETIVVLYLGRLSFHAKAHPLAMYQALEKSAKSTNKEVVLIECGWHANDVVKKIYRDAAAKFCPSIRVINLDGRKADNRRMAWASSDIFCSLSDNIQETFGIVPIEAMAAGIPVVVSDWDGYKDTVRHKIDGFRIPTSMPQDGLGKDLAYRHALGIDNYDKYCGLTCSLISVDIEETAKAFERLFLSSELRIRMGEDGRKRAKENYDWSVIISKYEDLWKQLNEIRIQNASKIHPLKHPWPGRIDPFYAFSSYPTEQITQESIVSLNNQTFENAIKKAIEIRQIKMFKYAEYILPSTEEIHVILESLIEKPKQIKEIVQSFKEEKKKVYVFRNINWLIKAGIIIRVA